MAAVITLQSSSATGPTPTPPSFQQQSQPHSPDHQHPHPPRRRLSRSQHQHNAGSPPSAPLSPVSSNLPAAAPRAPARDGTTSCDACLRRKSRCAMNEMVNKCYSCDFHRQECTFTLSAAGGPNPADAQSKKRKLEDSAPEDVDSVKRYASLVIMARTRSRTISSFIYGRNIN